jgi:general secretion pathway protein A
MYEGYYGVAENPFRLTPDPQYLYLSEGHKEALASLLYGLRARKGFVAVLGEAGTGKTTLLRYLLGQLDDSVRAVCILNTNVAFEELLGFVLRELGIETGGASKTEALEALRRFLHAQFQAGRTVAILVDEAQNLSPTVLEELRMLSNFETDKAKLLQIILVGQPPLREMLINPKMQQVRQRIGLICSLDPLSHKETAAYIKHRLRAAQFQGKRLFTRRAVSSVWKHSHGIPRLINVICDNALLIGYGSGRKRIGRRTIGAAARDLDRSLKGSLGVSGPFKWGWRTAVAVSLVLLGLGVKPLLSRYPIPHWQSPLQLEHEVSSSTQDHPSPLPDGMIERDLPAPPQPAEANLELPAQDQRTLLAILKGERSQAQPRSGGNVPLTSPSMSEGKAEWPKVWPSTAQDANSAPPSPTQKPVPLVKILTVLPGDTLRSLAKSVYGEASLLVLDRVMGVNPELKSVEHISIGHKLLFPDLSPERLVHQTVAGKHVIHAVTLSSAAEATELQARLSQQGYTVSILPVSISATQQWFRVLVGEFDEPQGAVRFWQSMKWQERAFR